MSTLKPLVLAAAAALTVTAHAGDKEVLDLLVKKGVITAEDRAKAIQESKTKANELNLNEVFSKEDAVKRLTFSGRVQVQYEGMGYSAASPTRVRTVVTDTAPNPDVVTSDTTVGGSYGQDAISTNDFILRRMYLGAKADIGDGFSGELVWNFADGSNGGEFDKAVFTAETRLGKFDIGYQKVQWGQEENTSSGKMAVIERSLATRYWAESNNGRRVGFGARHTGVHYSNKAILGEGGQGALSYGLSVVRAEQNANFSGSTAGANDLGYYGFASIEWKPLGLTAGVNVAENTHSGAAGAPTEVSGYNPYLRWVAGDVTLLGEYIDTDVGATNPTGYNLTGLYKVSEKVELVARYAALDTDGRGIRASDGLRNISVAPAADFTFREADSVFVGLNYYFNKDNAKIQVGYERANLTGGSGTISTTSDTVGGIKTDVTTSAVAGAAEADADILRVQVQILF